MKLEEIRKSSISNEYELSHLQREQATLRQSREELKLRENDFDQVRRSWEEDRLFQVDSLNRSLTMANDTQRSHFEEIKKLGEIIQA